VEENRDVLRRAAMARRRSLSRANCRSWSEAIQARALELPQYLDARTVALYSPVQNEVETGAILEDALTAGKRVFFPKLNRFDGAEFAQVTCKDELASGRFGIAEPAGTNGLALADAARAVVFLPGVLFDKRGHRLGRGGGWYDRALAQLGNRGFFVGLAYEVQIVDRLPEQSWDQRVHYLITENRLIDCGMRAL
jgi:5-formyltetrahydrofolate cyclo-ligase